MDYNIIGLHLAFRIRVSDNRVVQFSVETNPLHLWLCTLWFGCRSFSIVSPNSLILYFPFARILSFWLCLTFWHYQSVCTLLIQFIFIRLKIGWFSDFWRVGNKTNRHSLFDWIISFQFQFTMASTGAPGGTYGNANYGPFARHGSAEQVTGGRFQRHRRSLE